MQCVRGSHPLGLEPDVAPLIGCTLIQGNASGWVSIWYQVADHKTGFVKIEPVHLGMPEF